MDGMAEKSWLREVLLKTNAVLAEPRMMVAVT